MAECGFSCCVIAPLQQSPSATLAPSYPSISPYLLIPLHLSLGKSAAYNFWAGHLGSHSDRLLCAWGLTLCHRVFLTFGVQSWPANVEPCRLERRGSEGVGTSLVLPFKVTSARLCPFLHSYRSRDVTLSCSYPWVFALVLQFLCPCPLEVALF